MKKSFPTPGMCTLNDLSHGGGRGGEDELIKELSLETVTGIIQCYKSSLQEETPRCLDRKKKNVRARKMAQWFRVCAVLAEDPIWVPRTLIMWLSAPCNASWRGPEALF